MTQPARAARVYCGALLNARALARYILARHPRETILIVCSGSGNNFNFEDFYGAGYFVECFLEHVGDLSDAAKAAFALYRQETAIDAGRAAEVHAQRVEHELALIQKDSSRIEGRVAATQRQLRVQDTSVHGRRRRA